MEAHQAFGAPASAPMGELGTDAGRMVTIAAFSGIATALAKGVGLGPMLGSIVVAVSRAVAADRCLVYLSERGEGHDLVGAVAHEEHGVRPGLRWIGAARISPSASGIDQALSRSDIALLDLRSGLGEACSSAPSRPSLVVAIPDTDDTAGVMVLERRRAWDLDDEDRAWLRAFASLAGAAMATARRAKAARRQRQILTARVREQRQVASGVEQLLGAVLEGDQPAELLSMLASTLRLPCALLTPQAELSVTADNGLARTQFPPGCDQDVYVNGLSAAAVAALEPGHPRIVGASQEQAGDQRRLVTRLQAVPDTRVLVISESGREFSRADVQLAQSAASVLALCMRQQLQTLTVSEAERASIVRDAVSGSDTCEGLRCRAAASGIDLDRAMVVCLIGHGEGSADDGQQTGSGSVAVAHQLVAELGLARLELCARTRHGVVILAPLDPDVARGPAVSMIRSDLALLLNAWPLELEAPTATVSSVCRATGDLVQALSECTEIRRSAARLGLSTEPGSVLCADDLGVVRLMLCPPSGAAAERFAADIFGAIGEGDELKRTVATLDAFFAENHRVRAAARRLGIHENTVRYRLRKLADMAGVDVLSSGDDQLTVKLALSVLKLRSSVTTGKEH